MARPVAPPPPRGGRRPVSRRATSRRGLSARKMPQPGHRVAETKPPTRGGARAEGHWTQAMSTPCSHPRRGPDASSAVDISSAPCLPSAQLSLGGHGLRGGRDLRSDGEQRELQGSRSPRRRARRAPAVTPHRRTPCRGSRPACGSPRSSTPGAAARCRRARSAQDPPASRPVPLSSR